MLKLRGYFMPAYYPRTTGGNKQGGEFWIGFIDGQNEWSRGMIRIKLTVWADDSLSEHTFASLDVHYDGIKVLRQLEELDFLKTFEEIRASNFYDVAQCCCLSDIPITYHGGDYTKEMTSRKIYEILYGEKTEA